MSRTSNEGKDPHHLQHEAEHSRVPKSGSFLVYLVILFAAAFLLLLLSFLMQHRANQETIDGLTNTSNSALQSLNDLIEQKDALQAQVQQLQEENATLQGALSDQEQELEEAQRLGQLLSAYAVVERDLRERSYEQAAEGLRTLYDLWGGEGELILTLPTSDSEEEPLDLLSRLQDITDTLESRGALEEGELVFVQEEA